MAQPMAPDHPSLKAPFAQRADSATHPLTAYLLRLMDLKASNLCLSADVSTARELLSLADRLGPYIVVFKTHHDVVTGWDHTPGTGTGARLAALGRKHGFLIFEDRKFGDIGNTVQMQYAGGSARIIDWAHIVNVNMVPGPATVSSLEEAAVRWKERYHYEVRTSVSVGTPKPDEDDEDEGGGEGEGARGAGGDADGDADADAADAATPTTATAARDRRFASEEASAAAAAATAAAVAAATDPQNGISPLHHPKANGTTTTTTTTTTTATTTNGSTSSGSGSTSNAATNGSSSSLSVLGSDPSDAVGQALAYNGKESRKGSIVSITTVTQHWEPASSPRGPKALFEGDELLLAGIEEAPMERGLLILAQMSSKGNFMGPEYTQACVDVARKHKGFVMGFISQQGLNALPDDDFIHMTPGCQLPPEGAAAAAANEGAIAGDGKGQQYNTPRRLVEGAGVDVVIVGRGILNADNPQAEAQRYRREAWRAYLARIHDAREAAAGEE